MRHKRAPGDQARTRRDDQSDPAEIDQNEKYAERQADEQRQHRRDVAKAPNRFERLKVDVLVDREARIAKYETSQVKRGEEKEQAEFCGLPGGGVVPQLQYQCADNRGSSNQERIEDSQGIGLRANCLCLLAREKTLAHPHKYDFGETEVEQPH